MTNEILRYGVVKSDNKEYPWVIYSSSANPQGKIIRENIALFKNELSAREIAKLMNGYIILEWLNSQELEEV